MNLDNPTKEDFAAFGGNLRAEMARQGLTAVALSKRMPEDSPLDPATIEDGCANKWLPRRPLAFQLAWALEVPLDCLIGDADQLAHARKERQIAQMSATIVAGDSQRKGEELRLLRDTICRLMVPDWADHDWTDEMAERVLREAVATVGLGEYLSFSDRIPTDRLPEAEEQAHWAEFLALGRRLLGIVRVPVALNCVDYKSESGVPASARFGPDEPGVPTEYPVGVTLYHEPNVPTLTPERAREVGRRLLGRGVAAMLAANEVETHPKFYEAGE